MLEHILEALRLIRHPHDRLDRIERAQEEIMAGIAEINAAIAALPAEVTTSVVTVVTPLIEAAKLPVDFAPQVAAIQAIPGKVSDALKLALADTLTTSVTNADGSVTTTVHNADGTVTVTTKDAAGNVIANP